MTKLSSYLFLIIFTAGIFNMAEIEEPVKVKEFMEVINVEVPVRVFFKGAAVDNLKKSDFKLFENKKEVLINGFSIIRKKIKEQKLQLDTNNKNVYKPRYFVLVFRIIDFNKELKLGLKKIFDQVLRESDKLLVFANNKTIFFNNLSKKDPALIKIETLLSEQSNQARARLNNFIYTVQKNLNDRKVKYSLGSGPAGMGADTARQIELFIENYIQIWKEYKRRFLIPNIDKYYNFAKYLEKINLEKWVINFYQIELFPKIKMSGDLMIQIKDLIGNMMASDGEYVARGRMFSRLLATYERELNVAQDFPSEEISKLFFKVNATFHSIFFNTQRDMISLDLDLAKISTDIENSLREITRRTGGELITSNNIKIALNDVFEKKDILYLLTYSPENNNKTGKLKVTVNNPTYKVLYDSNIRQDYITAYLKKKQSQVPILQISNVEFKGKQLSVTVTGLIQATVKKRKQGLAEIWIQVRNPTGEDIFNQKKPVSTYTDKINISLDFSWLKKGNYDIIINVKDLLTKTTSFAFLQPVIE